MTARSLRPRSGVAHAASSTHCIPKEVRPNTEDGDRHGTEEDSERNGKAPRSSQYPDQHTLHCGSHRQRPMCSPRRQVAGRSGGTTDQLRHRSPSDLVRPLRYRFQNARSGNGNDVRGTVDRAEDDAHVTNPVLKAPPLLDAPYAAVVRSVSRDEGEVIRRNRR